MLTSRKVIFFVIVCVVNIEKMFSAAISANDTQNVITEDHGTDKIVISSSEGPIKMSNNSIDNQPTTRLGREGVPSVAYMEGNVVSMKNETHISLNDSTNLLPALPISNLASSLEPSESGNAAHSSVHAKKGVSLDDIVNKIEVNTSSIINIPPNVTPNVTPSTLNISKISQSSTTAPSIVANVSATSTTLKPIQLKPVITISTYEAFPNKTFQSNSKESTTIVIELKNADIKNSAGNSAPLVSVGAVPTDDVQSSSQYYQSNSKPSNNQPGLIIPIVITIFAVPLLALIAYQAVRRGREAWKNRHYRRMDYLIDGMYND